MDATIMLTIKCTEAIDHVSWQCVEKACHFPNARFDTYNIQQMLLAHGVP